MLSCLLLATAFNFLSFTLVSFTVLHTIDWKQTYLCGHFADIYISYYGCHYQFLSLGLLFLHWIQSREGSRTFNLFLHNVKVWIIRSMSCTCGVIVFLISYRRQTSKSHGMWLSYKNLNLTNDQNRQMTQSYKFISSFSTLKTKLFVTVEHYELFCRPDRNLVHLLEKVSR